VELVAYRVEILWIKKYIQGNLKLKVFLSVVESISSRGGEMWPLNKNLGIK
jgi:hypothetical protein